MPESVTAWKTSDGRVHPTEERAKRWERFIQLATLITEKIGKPANLYSGEEGPFIDWLLAHWDILREVLNTPELNSGS